MGARWDRSSWPAARTCRMWCWRSATRAWPTRIPASSWPLYPCAASPITWLRFPRTTATSCFSIARAARWLPAGPWEARPLEPKRLAAGQARLAAAHVVRGRVPEPRPLGHRRLRADARLWPGRGRRALGRIGPAARASAHLDHHLLGGCGGVRRRGRRCGAGALAGQPGRHAGAGSAPHRPGQVGRRDRGCIQRRAG